MVKVIRVCCALCVIFLIIYFSLSLCVRARVSKAAILWNNPREREQPTEILLAGHFNLNLNN